MKILTLLLTAASLLGTTAGFSIQNEQASVSSFLDHVIDGKYYVTPGTVYVAPEGIYLNLEGEFISVSSLGVDENGVYVLASDLLIEKAPRGMWECYRCHKYNWNYRDTCTACGLGRGRIDD